MFDPPGTINVTTLGVASDPPEQKLPGVVDPLEKFICKKVDISWRGVFAKKVERSLVFGEAFLQKKVVSFLERRFKKVFSF